MGCVEKNKKGLWNYLMKKWEKKIEHTWEMCYNVKIEREGEDLEIQESL